MHSNYFPSLSLWIFLKALRAKSIHSLHLVPMSSENSELGTRKRTSVTSLLTRILYRTPPFNYWTASRLALLHGQYSSWPMLLIIFIILSISIRSDLNERLRYPLFAFIPRDLGGLGFSEAQIGTHMATRAFVIVCIIMLSAPLQHRLGTLRTYQLGMSTWPLTVVFLPILSKTANSESYGSGHPCFWLVFSAFYLSWGFGSLVWRE